MLFQFVFLTEGKQYPVYHPIEEFAEYRVPPIYPTYIHLVEEYHLEYPIEYFLGYPVYMI